jgi:hypothetical protein
MSRVACSLVALLLSFAVVAPARAADPPEISVTSSLPSTWVTGGTYTVDATATSPGNLKGLTIGLPTIERLKQPLATCAGCERLSLIADVKVGLLRDGTGDIVVVADGMDGTKSVSRIPVRVDNTAPAALEAVGLDGQPGWRAANGFNVRWGALAPEAGSPIVAARYQLCPQIGGVDCVSARRVLEAADGIDRVLVPGDGEWRLQVALEDEAGHVGAASAATSLLLDATPPTVAFAPAPDDPLGVVLHAADAHSGVASMTIEARLRGSEAWQVLASGGGDSLIGRLDTERLAPGTYEVRGRAVDAVGNERTASAWRSGGSVHLVLPAKIGSTLTAGIGSGKRLDARPVLSFGRAATIKGSVKDAAGNPRAGVAVTVSERTLTPGAPWRSVSTVKTGRTGGFSYRAEPGASRTLRFAYPGSVAASSASAEVVLRVRALTSLTASKRRLRNGETITLRGRLRGAPIPATGKIMTLQARIPGGWRTFGTARARASDGRWSYRYTFTRTSATARYTFRVVVPREDAFPYATGVSRPLRVVVSGPR